MDLERACHYYKLAADQHYPNASKSLMHTQFDIGYMYERGDGVPKDIERACAYYKLAASKGHPGAKANLQRLQQK